MKRLLALSHAGVLEVNRALFHEMTRLADVEITLIVPTAWRGDLIQDLRFSPAESDAGTRVIPVPALLSGNGSLFFYRKRLRALAREFRPDHVFIDEEPWSLAALQATVAFGDSEISFFTKQNLKKKLPPPFPWIERFVHARSHHAYVVADEVGDVLRGKNYGKSIRFLPHSYDPVLFTRLDPAPRAVLRTHLSPALAAADAVVIGYFGRLTAEKGIGDLIEAMERLVREDSHARFLFVGSGPLEGEVRAAVTRVGANRAVWLPAIPHLEVGRTLACCDILALPSRTTPAWKEQYGRILVEAMACGVAVLGSDSGEIPHLIRRAGGGTVFREGSVDDLTEKLRDLVRSGETRQRFAGAGQAYVEAHLTHAAVATFLARDLGFSLKSG